MLKMSYHLNRLSPVFLHLTLSLPNPFLATEPASSPFKGGWEVKSHSGSYTPELTTPPQVLTGLQYCGTGLYFCNAHIWAGLVAQTWNPCTERASLGPLKLHSGNLFQKTLNQSHHHSQRTPLTEAGNDMHSDLRVQLPPISKCLDFPKECPFSGILLSMTSQILLKAPTVFRF